MKEKNFMLLKIFNALTFVIMITINALANTLPINGITTGEISDSYQNLFAPAGITFAIWGVIYLLLALFVLFSFGVFKGKTGYRDDAVRRVRFCFIVSSIANSIWIFAWHYKKIGISLILMLVIFTTLAMAFVRINSKEITKKERLFVNVPFGVYFGWITIATIANVTTLLVSINWNGFGIAESVWMIIIVILGLLISSAAIMKFKSIVYALVIMWAYIGILIKHLSASGFNGEYTGVIITVSVSLLILAIETIMIWINKRKS